MSLADCIANAVRGGEIDAARAQRLRDILAEEGRAFTAQRGRAAGAADEAEIDRRAFDRLERETVERARRTRLQMDAADRVRAVVLGRRAMDGKFDPGGALPDLIEHFGTSPHESVQMRQEYVRGQAHAILTEVLFAFERGPLSGTRNRPLLEDVARAAHGDAVGNGQARELARAWGEAAEFLRLRFNKAGGAIPKLENWGLPHLWDADMIARAGFDAWRAKILPELDRARMIDHATGRALSDERLDALMRETFDAISTGGWSRTEPSANGGRPSIGASRQEHRFLIFRDGEAWSRVNREFGQGDPFFAMMHHVDAMSRDIAAMEILGPNPAATLRLAGQIALKEAAEGRAEQVSLFTRATGGAMGNRNAPEGHVRDRIRLMEDMWNLYNGASMGGPTGRFDKVVGDLANLSIAADLGSSWISTWSDTGFTRMARSMNGLPEGGAIRNVLKLMNPANPEHRKRAVRAGAIAEGAAQVMRGQGRVVNEFASSPWSKRVADVTLRTTLMSPHTQGFKWSFKLEMQDFFGSQYAGRALGDLPEPVRATFARYGIDETDWNALRAHGVEMDADGNASLTTEQLRRSGLNPDEADRLAAKWMGLINTEVLYAAPNATLRSRAFLGAGVAARSSSPFVRFLIRSAGMYSNFPVTVMMLYSARGAQRMLEAGGLTAASMVGKTLVYTTLFGALALQFKEIINGRDPRPMDSPEFWAASMMQGGGLGLMGDFLFSDRNRFGGGQAASLAGPLVGRAVQLGDLTVGNAMQLARGEETNFGRELTQFVRRNTPGGSIWYLRLAYQRMVLDQMQAALDPGAQQSFRRIERRWQRDFGQGYWWRPGDAAPERAPDMTNVVSED